MPRIPTRFRIADLMFERLREEAFQSRVLDCNKLDATYLIM